MYNKIKVAILGSTGYVGIEIIRILLNHPHVIINFLGCENISNKKNENFKKFDSNNILPNLALNKDFNPEKSDIVFLSLPHGASHHYVKKIFSKIKIIDLSADFRLDEEQEYNNNYDRAHSCPDLLKDFIYGLPEINNDKIKHCSNIAVPGCYPTSVLLPLIPLLDNDLINTNNIIIDSKSGYSGAGKKFNLKNVKNLHNLNFYNYNTNQHRHICEIQQEIDKHTFNLEKVNFSFNPHILPIFRGMMSTIYCDLKEGIVCEDIKKILSKFYNNSIFVNLSSENKRADFFVIQNTNQCIIKLFNHHSNNRIILVSLIDNLLKGAAGQAIQCFNILYNIEESISLLDIK